MPPIAERDHSTARAPRRRGPRRPIPRASKLREMEGARGAGGGAGELRGAQDQAMAPTISARSAKTAIILEANRDGFADDVGDDGVEPIFHSDRLRGGGGGCRWPTVTSAPSRAPGSASSLAAPSPAMVVRTMRRGWSGGCPRPRCSGCPRERGRAAAVRDDLRGQRGALGRDAPAGAVGVPLVVALRQEALVASVLPDVGEHDDSWAGPDVAGGQAPLQRAETAAEGDLHRLGKMLAGKTQDGECMPRAFEGSERALVQRGEPDAADGGAGSRVRRRALERQTASLARRAAGAVQAPPS